MNNQKIHVNHRSFSGKIANIMQWLLNISLVMLAIILCFFLIKELISLTSLIFHVKEITNHASYLLTEKIVVFFLYFEFLSLIVKYFQTNYHFPLHYFLYIGITAMIRLIIIEHSASYATLIYAGSILLMIIALFIAHSERLQKS